MNLRLLVGIVLFAIGLVTAVIGIANVANPAGPASVMTEPSQSPPLAEAAGSLLIPLVAGLSLAIGGLLIGISLGNWNRPRTHMEPGDEVVNPEGHHKMKHV
jgi:hypothetical protein